MVPSFVVVPLSSIQIRPAMNTKMRMIQESNFLLLDIVGASESPSISFWWFPYLHDQFYWAQFDNDSRQDRRLFLIILQKYKLPMQIGFKNTYQEEILGLDFEWLDQEEYLIGLSLERMKLWCLNIGEMTASIKHSSGRQLWKVFYRDYISLCHS